MNPEIKAEWLKRLRDPKRKQAKSYLHTSEGQCCLGVVCEILSETHPNKVVKRKMQIGFYSYNQETATLPEAARLLVQLTSMGEMDYLRDRDGFRVTLVELNDHGFTFPQIADIIEYFL